MVTVTSEEIVDMLEEKIRECHYNSTISEEGKQYIKGTLCGIIGVIEDMSKGKEVLSFQSDKVTHFNRISKEL